MSYHAKFCVNKVTCCHSGEFQSFAQFSVLDPCHNAPEAGRWPGWWLVVHMVVAGGGHCGPWFVFRIFNGW